MAQNNTIGCWHASGSPHDATSICPVIVVGQYWYNGKHYTHDQHSYIAFICMIC